MAAKSLSKEQIRGKLLQGTFANSTPAAQLSDPIIDTPMFLTLEQLRPYDHNPRLNRNPRYDDLRASIMSRGLDAPPPVTRRPGEEHFIIRNGGNTRLAILNELWRETNDERFFRIHCLFRPWPNRGEILALTGHLAESDLHGELTFIERALGVERAREFYQQEVEAPLSQRELAKLLKQDGYPISQPHISKMQDAVRYLLPAIPNTLYAGLGKPQIEKLTGLRRASERAWLKHAGAGGQECSHEHLFQEILSAFDHEDFIYERFQDELLHKMGQLLGQDYNSLKLDVLDPDRPNAAVRLPVSTQTTELAQSLRELVREVTHAQPVSDEVRGQTFSSERFPHPEQLQLNPSDEKQRERMTANKLSSISEQLAQSSGETIPSFELGGLQSIPVLAGGVHPVADLWDIERAIDSPKGLRQTILVLAQDIASEVGLPLEYLGESEWGIGFVCVRPESWGSDLFAGSPKDLNPDAYALLNVLDGLSGRFAPALNMLRSSSGAPMPPEMNGYRFLAELGQLLLGSSLLNSQPASAVGRLSDVALIKLFRVIRLARRLIELESNQFSCEVIQ